MAAKPVQTEESYAFGPFELFPGRREFLKDGIQVPIGGRPFDVLTTLVRQGGSIISKRELMAQVWPGFVVDDANLKVNVAALRRVLGDDTGQPRYIATIIGRGYRFIAPIGPPGGKGTPALAARERATAGNLPRQTGPIFGRSEVIAGIAQDLETARLVSIVGPGGIGKTTVALAIARQLAPAFPDGAWFVDLTEVEAGLTIDKAIARTLGLGEPIDLTDALRELNALLVLDNCEHVIEASAMCVDGLLSRTRNVKLLTTTREPLSIRAERVRRLSGLAVPPVHSRAAEALEYAAVQLFVDRASTRSFRLDDANTPAVSEICRRVDGLALGIERIAMRADTLDVGWMLDHIESRQHMLDGDAAGPDRHRTLTAVVDWSYRLLAEDEQRVMRRLSMLAGSFDLDLAGFVAGSVELTPADIVEIVAGLAAKSLLAVAPRNGEAEYRLSNVARAFGFEQLVASGELAHAQRRRAEGVLWAIERAEGTDRHALQAALLEDLREALAWATDDAAGEDLAVRLAIVAAPLFVQQGLVEACHAAVSSVLDRRFLQHAKPGDEEALLAVLAATALRKSRSTGQLKE
jgi:predicted ATPase/DNA-binding winged helix-turn-helix (wHTH) protein